MKSVLAVLLGMLAIAAASECDVLARLKVKNQWAEAYGIGVHRVKFATHVFHRFFEAHPETRKELFSRVHGYDETSTQFRSHMVRVLGSLDIIISLIDDEPTLISHLGHLAAQHKERAVTADHFADFGVALFDTLPSELGDHHFDYEAWNACYSVISAGIQG